MLLKILKKMLQNRAMTAVGKGVGPLGPLLGEFQSRRGHFQTKASSGAAVTARNRLVLLIGVVELQEDLCVIYIFYWIFL
jgi:hypothetical protein